MIINSILISRVVIFDFHGFVLGTITESNMLNCDFYNTFCRWNNFVNGTNSLDWKIASVVATDFFHSIPRGVLGQGREIINHNVIYFVKYKSY